MAATIVETETYRRKAALLLAVEERDELRRNLAENPEIHPVIPETGGLRKARWKQPSRGKGKRGGVRVIYFQALSAGLVALLDIYSKDEKEDLNDADKKALRKAVDEIKRRLR